jgi:hypothetical protein
MTNFNFSLYDDEDDYKPIKERKPAPLNENKKFNFDLYDDGPTNEDPVAESAKKDKVYQQYATPDYNSEDIKKMSLEEKLQLTQDLKTEKEFRQSSGFNKSLLSDLSFGFSERIEGLKPQPHDLNQGLGTAAGSVPAIAGGFEILKQGLKHIPTAYKWGTRAAKTLGAGTIGGAFEASKQVGKGEEMDYEKIATSAATFAAFDAALRTIPKGYEWLQNLGKKNQEELLINGVIPENLPPTQYKFYQDKVVPKLREVAEAEHEAAFQRAIEENDLNFKQKMENVKAEHENDLYQIEKLKSEHQIKAQEIEEANKLAVEEYQKSSAEWEQTKAREAVVEEAIGSIDKQNGNAKPLENVSKSGEDVGIRPQPIGEATTKLGDRIGNNISKERIENPTVAGEKNTAAVRASAKEDRKAVSKLYDKSDELNKGIVDTHEELANELRSLVEDLSNKGNLTPEESVLLRNANTTLNKLISFDEAGSALGFEKVDNQFLLDQAKTLRNSMDYDFSQGNSTGIYKPLIESYQQAAKNAAVAAGRTDAAAANDAARAGHAEWSRLYQNRYIRQYRNLSSDKPTSLFDNSLSIDNFRQLDKVLSRSNSGQNLSAQTRRALIDKKMSKLYKDPRDVHPSELDAVLNDLAPVLKDGEAEMIRNSFRQERKSLNFQGKKVESPSQPKAPKLNTQNSSVKEPSFVRIPKKPNPKTTPEMKEAAELLNITPEKAIKLSETPSGIKYLNEKLAKAKGGKQITEEAGKRKIKDILFEGKPKQTFKGDDMFKIINKGGNYDMISEILGEEMAAKLLKAAEEIGQNNMTREMVYKITKNSALIKVAQAFGIF